MDREVLDAILAIKAKNVEEIYMKANERLERHIRPMMTRLYERFLDDLERKKANSWIRRHHLDAWMLEGNEAYRNEAPEDIVADYIASMTDDYFIDLYNELYPGERVPPEELYVGYFQ